MDAAKIDLYLFDEDHQVLWNINDPSNKIFPDKGLLKVCVAKREFIKVDDIVYDTIYNESADSGGVQNVKSVIWSPIFYQEKQKGRF